jgi:hypothetical protein
MKPFVGVRQALGDPKLLGGMMAGDSWAIWRMLLAAAMGEPLAMTSVSCLSALLAVVSENPAS